MYRLDILFFFFLWRKCPVLEMKNKDIGINNEEGLTRYMCRLVSVILVSMCTFKKRKQIHRYHKIHNGNGKET